MGASGTTQTTTRIKILSREVKLTYLQTVQVYGGQQDLGNIAGEGGGIGSVSSATSDPGDPGFLGIGAEGPSSMSKQANDSGWVIARSWLETHFDKSRYAIGIRDIGIFFYRFSPVSELVSIPFRSPREIYKVQMRVIEQVPSAYPVGPRYIEYFVSHNDGKEWYQINPLDHPTLTGKDGLIVPRTITFNPDVGGEGGELAKFVRTDVPVMGLRYRLIIRGSDSVPDPDRHTPLVKQVKMLMYPRGGLSRTAGL